MTSDGFAAFLPELNALLYGKGRVHRLNVHGEAHDVVPLAFTERAGLLCRENGEEKELLFGEL
ncbi:MAG: hypothetical protein U5N26_01540 [Candidatus Marinimicrobia bacterium]|nr:hypothetical protein [Candidatus Neomarinimicrobiota bacterium]